MTTNSQLRDLEKKPFTSIIVGPRVKLTHASPLYAQQVWDYIQRDHAKGARIYTWVKSLDEVAQYVTKEVTTDSKDIHYLIFVEDKCIGSAHIHTLSYLDHKAEVGYALEQDEEGQGYASEALQLVLAEMKRLGFNKAIINTDKNNTRSMKVAERNGFHLEGTFVQDYIENGQFVDSVIYGKLLR